MTITSLAWARQRVIHCNIPAWTAQTLSSGCPVVLLATWSQHAMARATSSWKSISTRVRASSRNDNLWESKMLAQVPKTCHFWRNKESYSEFWFSKLWVWSKVLTKKIHLDSLWGIKTVSSGYDLPMRHVAPWHLLLMVCSRGNFRNYPLVAQNAKDLRQAGLQECSWWYVWTV